MNPLKNIRNTLVRLARNLGMPNLSAAQATITAYKEGLKRTQAPAQEHRLGNLTGMQIIESPPLPAQEVHLGDFLNRATRRALRKEGRKFVPVHSNAPPTTKNVKRVGYEQALRNFAERVYLASQRNNSTN